MTVAKKNIYQRLHEVMKAIDFVQKTIAVKNKSGGIMYKAVSHDEVIANVRPELIKNGIVTPVNVLSMEQDSNRTKACVQVEYVNIDDPEDRVVTQSYGYGIDGQDKGPGKAISYAVKYCHLKTLSLETGDDPERDNIDHKPKNPPANQPPQDNGSVRYMTEKQVKRIYALCKKHSIMAQDVKMHFKFEHLNEIPIDRSDEVFAFIEGGGKQAPLPPPRRESSQGTSSSNSERITTKNLKDLVDACADKGLDAVAVARRYNPEFKGLNELANDDYYDARRYINEQGVVDEQEDIPF